MKYPISESSVRPFRLWDAKAKAAVRYRNYKHMLNAQKEALWICRGQGGELDVYDVHTGNAVARYVRRGNVIDIWERK